MTLSDEDWKQVYLEHGDPEEDVYQSDIDRMLDEELFGDD